MPMAPAPIDRIEIVTSDARWPSAFAIEAARIREALLAHGEPAIEHIGSTAVPGLDGIVPLLFWLFDPLLLVGATTALIFFLYHLDRAPRNDKDLMG